MRVLSVTFPAIGVKHVVQAKNVSQHGTHHLGQRSIFEVELDRRSCHRRKGLGLAQQFSSALENPGLLRLRRIVRLLARLLFTIREKYIVALRKIGTEMADEIILCRLRAGQQQLAHGKRQCGSDRTIRQLHKFS